MAAETRPPHHDEPDQMADSGYDDRIGRLAQRLERCSYTADVTGSNPVTPIPRVLKESEGAGRITDVIVSHAVDQSS